MRQEVLGLVQRKSLADLEWVGLECIAPHCTALHCIALHIVLLDYTACHVVALCWIALLISSSVPVVDCFALQGHFVKASRKRKSSSQP